MGNSSDHSWPTPHVVVEVEERRADRGCSETDRRWFRNRALPRLEQEFGECLEVRWRPVERGVCSVPTIRINGEVLYSGGFLPWETLRPAVAQALALEWAVLQDHVEARHIMREAGLDSEDWQDGLLGWIHGLGDDSEGA